MTLNCVNLTGDIIKSGFSPSHSDGQQYLGRICYWAKKDMGSVILEQPPTQRQIQVDHKTPIKKKQIETKIEVKKKKKSLSKAKQEKWDSLQLDSKGIFTGYANSENGDSRL